MKARIISTFIVFVCMLNSLAVFAQEEDEEGPEVPPPVPIDQYVIILLLAGIAFAWYVFYRTRKNN